MSGSYLRLQKHNMLAKHKSDSVPHLRVPWADRIVARMMPAIVQPSPIAISKEGRCCRSYKCVPSTHMYEQQRRHFEKILRIFDKNQDEVLTWDEIAALFGHRKLKKDFAVGAGEDGTMDFQDFRRFMKYETGIDSDICYDSLRTRSWRRR